MDIGTIIGELNKAKEIATCPNGCWTFCCHRCLVCNLPPHARSLKAVDPDTIIDWEGNTDGEN